MRTVCWRCGETVTHRAFAKPKEVLCPDCGEAVFLPLRRAKTVFDALILALATGAVWLLGERLWELKIWGGLLLLAAVPLGQYLLWPLARKMAYAVYAWHWDVTGIMWGRHDLPCWRCGRTVTVYTAPKEVCPGCGAALLRPVRWVGIAFSAGVILLFLGAVFLAIRRAQAENPLHGLVLVLASSVVMELLDIPGDALQRRAYHHWLERYRAGEAAPPRTGT